MLTWLSLSSHGKQDLDTWRELGCYFPFLCPKYAPPLWFPGPTELGVPAAEFLDGWVDSPLTPLFFIYKIFLFLTWSKNLWGTSQEQGPLLALGRVRGLDWKAFLFFFPRKWNSNWNHMSSFSELQSKGRTWSPAAGSAHGALLIFH